MSDDLDLFIEQARWVTPLLRDPTRKGFVNWVGRRLHPDARDRLARLLPIHHPSHRVAEEALYKLLGRSLVVHRDEVRVTHHISRRIDWPATYVGAVLPGTPPQPFRHRLQRNVPDRMLLGALAGLARSWEASLDLALDAAATDKSGDLSRRRALLRRATSPAHIQRMTTSAYTHRHARRLRGLDAESARCVEQIEIALRFWHEKFGEDDDHKGLAALGGILQDGDASNIDTLLELTTSLSIARAALQSDERDWPTDSKWELLSVDEAGKSYPDIRLQSGELVCEISKGAPTTRDADGHREDIRDAVSPWADEVLPGLSVKADHSRSSGHQPDVVVTFWLESRPERSEFVLGDAKRNEGEGYIRDALGVAATYLMAFGYRMGLRMAGGSIQTAITPGVTLFCRRGTRPDIARTLDLLRSKRRPPVVMAFDLEQHFGPPQSGPWHSPVLAAWLGCLGRQALHKLKAGGGQ